MQELFLGNEKVSLLERCKGVKLDAGTVPWGPY